ncbi:SIMPL domain-containing protein [Sphingomonas cannabina]|uniref:SIMPL domain-containing protein n=1 Tax=Sphingomonas cannabina TaxID=2899123 RepID=UPI001F289941|nr:SIMPL domain-containing protein [Sphingomonas cannabina]UIJ44279.1 SIMPL domain-containing protein [Sphingomonas cannabina]
MKRRTILAASALMAAMPASAQTALTTLAPGETLLEVNAAGEAKATPDIAEFSTSVTSDGTTAQAALAANAKVAERLVGAVREAGVADADVRTSDLSVGPRYRPDKDGGETDEIIGYRASNRLSIRIRDIGAAPRVIDALMNAGATGLNGPTFSFSDDAPLKAKARTDAVAAAERQARDYAAALGMRIARVLRVSERSARHDGDNDIIVTGYAAGRAKAPVKPGEQSVAVTVWIDYALAK